MPICKVTAESVETGERKDFWYDNTTQLISDAPFDPRPADKAIDLSTRGKTKPDMPFHKIKIQLGLSCNYSCSYCSQRFVERAEETNPKDIDAFIEMFKTMPKTEDARIEFWGGEPLVYWKTLKPLAEKLRALHPKSHFVMVTNGSLLTRAIVDWIDGIDMGIAVSHDGPGQHMRSDDPLVTNEDAIRYAVSKLVPKNRMAISVMLNKQNVSRLAVTEFFKAWSPDQFIPLSEGGFIDAYSDDGLETISLSTQEQFETRKTLWAELRFKKMVRGAFFGQNQAINNMAYLNEKKGEHQLFSQKCGMSWAGTVAVDLRGNVLTCQNISSVAIAPNGKPHKLGHVSDLGAVRLNTSTHWSMRQNCPTCPVLALCKGSCMFLHGKEFDASCEVSYTDKITLFAAGFEQVTGYVPIKIEAPGLPAHRQDVFGTEFDHAETPKKKVIPIKSV